MKARLGTFSSSESMKRAQTPTVRVDNGASCICVLPTFQAQFSSKLLPLLMLLLFSNGGRVPKNTQQQAERCGKRESRKLNHNFGVNLSRDPHTHIHTHTYTYSHPASIFPRLLAPLLSLQLPPFPLFPSSHYPSLLSRSHTLA